MTEIFLLEDSRPLRTVLTSQLRDAGYNVTSFEDGRASEKPDLVQGADLIVTDLDMPVVDGFEAISNIRETSPELPIIVISGTSKTVPEDLNVAGVLRKPFNESDLMELVRASLRRVTS